jgi:cysteine-rich repeat protein
MGVVLFAGLGGCASAPDEEGTTTAGGSTEPETETEPEPETETVTSPSYTSGACGNDRRDVWDDGLGHRGVEECDDGNVAAGDGCSATCFLEEGYVCNDEQPQICTSETTSEVPTGGFFDPEPSPVPATTTEPAGTASVSPGAAVSSGAAGVGGLPASGNGGTGSVVPSMGGAPNQGDGGVSPAGGNASGGGAGEVAGGGGVSPLPVLVECSDQDLSTLPIDESRVVAAECNAFGIQGEWYCYDDGVNPTSCAEGVPEYRAGEGLCLTGSTSVDPTFSAWGAGIGLVLNATEAGATFDAAAQGIIGFRINISGDAGGLQLRINFQGDADLGGGIAPFWPVPGAGNYDVLMADAVVPEAWGVPESGTVPNESALYAVDITLAGGELATDYDICIESLTPITSAR